MKQKPNKAPEPTPGPVTDRAGHAPRQFPSWLIFDVRQKQTQPHSLSMNSEIKKRTIAIGAFCSGAVGGSAGGFKEWAANISPAYSGFLGALLATLIGALAYSVLIRRYVHPIECEQAKA